MIGQVSDRTVHSLDRRGFVRDWLISPAWSTPCEDLGSFVAADGDPWGDDGRWVLTNGPDVAPLKERILAGRPAVLDQALPVPVEGGEVSWRLQPSDTTVAAGNWRRVHTGADGLVDWSRFCFVPEYRQSLASTTLEVDQAEYRTLQIACTGPVAVFINGELLAEYGDVAYMDPVVHTVRLRLTSGLNVVHLLTRQVAFREVRHVVSVRVVGLPVRVVLASPGADEVTAAAGERVLNAVGTGPWALTDHRVQLTGPVGARLLVGVGAAEHPVNLVDGRAEIDLGAQASAGGTGRSVGQEDGLSEQDSSASMLATGETALRLRVDDPRVPQERQAHVVVLPPAHRQAPVGGPAEWRQELLQHVRGGAPGSARALARNLVDPTQEFDPADLEGPLGMLASRSDCADFEAVGLMHLLHRLGDAGWEQGHRDRVEQSLLDFKYWIDQPGLDAMCYFTENHQLVWHTAELLAGERFAARQFTNTGWLGAEHREHGRSMVVQWLRSKLSGGFSEFDSNAYLAIDTLALVSLVELAVDTEVRTMAEALLDKVLLTLACNSWRGTHGAAHGRSYVPTLRSSRLEETAPLMWLLWGSGALNAAVLPATALASARVYQTPSVVRAVATELAPEWDGRQVYRGRYRLRHDLLERPYGSDLRVWRTPDAMLSSVQDYRSGLPGLQEHVWGATLSPEVQVFATHPAADSTSPSARPNAWAGQRVLPRVHQHRDTLLVLHRYPDGDWAATTHLWFPTHHLDEWELAGSWLAGRVGDGFVAVAAAGGLQPTTVGEECGQAWLPAGDGRAWVATVGRAATDGSFATFVAGLAEPAFSVDAAGEPTVAWCCRDDRRLALGWNEPFLVDGALVEDSNSDDAGTTLHLDNPACRNEFGADELHAEWAGHRLELNLGAGRRLVPPSGITGEADHAQAGTGEHRER